MDTWFEIEEGSGGGGFDQATPRTKHDFWGGVTAGVSFELGSPSHNNDELTDYEESNDSATEEKVNMAFENLPDIIERHKHMLRVQQHVPIEEQFQKLFSSGQAKVATDRQSLWKPQTQPVQVAMNSNAQEQMDALNSGGVLRVPGAMPGIAPKLKTGKASDLPKGEAKTPAELDAIRADQLRIEQKLGLGKKKPAHEETEAEIAKRLGL